MTPEKIHEILDLALSIRRRGGTFNPLFVGDAGLGKSQICQQWVKKQRETNPEFGFLDLRIAYLEAPDMIGLPSITDGKTSHNIPDFWPSSGEGLILLEEPNRGTTGVMNTLMQVLTDRTVHGYRLPDGWILASCMNPDSAEYDVHQMDTALRNRFVEFDIEYDHMAFCNYMERNGWSESIQMFIRSGSWAYKPSKSIGNSGKYVSPRSWAPLNDAELAGISNTPQIHYEICCSLLGTHVGREYWAFCHNDRPVTAADIVRDKQSAIKQLKKQSSKNNYRGDMITATIESIIQHYGGPAAQCPEGMVSEEAMCEVAMAIPADQAINLLRGCAKKQSGGNQAAFITHIAKTYPELIGVLKDHIRLKR